MRTSVLTVWFCAAVFNIASASDSLRVRKVSMCHTGEACVSLAVLGNYAYTAGDTWLVVISIADPANPVVVGRSDTTPGLLAHGLAASGSYVYAAAFGDYPLRVYSVADPTHPYEVGHCYLPDSAYQVVVKGDYAYVADREGGLCVVSVADPRHPYEVGSWVSPDTMSAAVHVKVSGDYAYIADGEDGLKIVSIADPTHPVLVGQDSLGEMGGVAVSGNYAYAGTLNGGLFILSVADPTHPNIIGSVGGLSLGIEDIALGGGYAFVLANYGLPVVTVVDPAHPTKAGDLPCGGFYSVVYTVGHYLYTNVEPNGGVVIFKFWEYGDLDIAPDSLNVSADTLHLRRWVAGPGESLARAYGELILGNTSAAYNPDTSDGPSQSLVDSLRCTGSLTGPGGTIDSIVIPNLPASLAQGQTVVCTLAAYMPVGLRDGDYTGTVVISGKDTAGLLVQDSCYVLLQKLGDIDVVNDSLDVHADTVRVRQRLVSPGPPPQYIGNGKFVLVNTSASYNPDTSDGPSRSPVDSLGFSGSLKGPGGTIDSILIRNLPASLAQGQSVTCTLAVNLPAGLEAGDYTGAITIAGKDTTGAPVRLSFCALVRNTAIGDLDVDDDSLSVVHDTINLHAQPAGPVYHPYAKAEFMLVNSSSAYNPDTADGPSRSTLREIKVETRMGTAKVAKVRTQAETIDSIYVLNLPESLAVGQAVECTLALVLPVGTQPSGYSGVVTISALDTAGYEVQDSFFLTVRGPQPRQNLDSLRVAPIPFKPNQNPAHDAIHFQGLSAGARVTVYDASGQTVWTAAELGDGQVKWDAKVASGIYVYLVVSADGKSSKVGKLSVIR